VLSVDPGTDWQAKEVILEMEQVLLVHQSEGSIGENGEIVPSVRSHPKCHRPNEILVAPAADALFRMRSDVASEEDAKRGFYPASSTHEGAVILNIGVTATSS